MYFCSLASQKYCPFENYPFFSVDIAPNCNFDEDLGKYWSFKNDGFEGKDDNYWKFGSFIVVHSIRSDYL